VCGTSAVVVGLYGAAGFVQCIDFSGVISIYNDRHNGGAVSRSPQVQQQQHAQAVVQQQPRSQAMQQPHPQPQQGRAEGHEGR
jgi:hypothetical protein